MNFVRQTSDHYFVETHLRCVDNVGARPSRPRSRRE